MSNQEIFGLHQITKKYLKELCKKHKLYQTPHLNDQLYLHFQGFQSIENLEEYVGLKCLWLESNAISEIQGLEFQTELKCLFLQNNVIKKIENLQYCATLDTLNLASNHITKIENCGIEVLPELASLNLSRNYLRNSEGLRELENCKNISSLDLSHNRIDDILVVKIFANMPKLKVLVLQGNPVVSQVPQYRKTLILECKNLTYLDSRPVFPRDRACAEAWKRGGYEEERKEQARWNRMDRKKVRDSVNATLRLRQKHGAGDGQLLESTDDEEDNSHPKKLRQIPEEAAYDDLEITGVNQNPSQGLAEISDSSSISSNKSLTFLNCSHASKENAKSSLNAADCSESNNNIEVIQQNDEECTSSVAEKQELDKKTVENKKMLDVEILKNDSALKVHLNQSTLGAEKINFSENSRSEDESRKLAEITRYEGILNNNSELQFPFEEKYMDEEGLNEEKEKNEVNEIETFKECGKQKIRSLETDRKEIESDEETKAFSECVLGGTRMESNIETVPQSKSKVKMEENAAVQNENKELLEESIQTNDDFSLSGKVASNLMQSTPARSPKKICWEETTVCSPYSSSKSSSGNNLSDFNMSSNADISVHNVSEDSNSSNIRIERPEEGEEEICSLNENDKEIKHSEIVIGEDEEYSETDFDRLKKSSILEAFVSDSSLDSKEYSIESIKFDDLNEDLDKKSEGKSGLCSPRKQCKEDMEEQNQRANKACQQEDYKCSLVEDDFCPIDHSMYPDLSTKHMGLDHFIDNSDEEISDLIGRPTSVRSVDDCDDDEYEEYIQKYHNNCETSKSDNKTVQVHFISDFEEDAGEATEDIKYPVSLISTLPSHKTEADTSSNQNKDTSSTSPHVLPKMENTSTNITDQTNAVICLDTTVSRRESNFISTHKEKDLSAISCENQIKALETEQNKDILSQKNLPEEDDLYLEDTIASSWLENFLVRSSEEAILSTKNLEERMENDHNFNEVRDTLQFDPSEDTIASKWLENYLAEDVYLNEEETSLNKEQNLKEQVKEKKASKEESEEPSTKSLEIVKESESSQDSNDNANSNQQVKEKDDSNQSLEDIIEVTKCSETTEGPNKIDVLNRQAKLKVDQKSLIEQVIESEKSEVPRDSNEIQYGQSLKEIVEGSNAEEKENDVASSNQKDHTNESDKPLPDKITKKISDSEVLEEAFTNESLNHQVEEKDCEELQLGTRAETHLMGNEVKEGHLSKRHPNQTQTSENLNSKSEKIRCKTHESSMDNVEDVGAKSQSLSWWEKTLDAARREILKEAQSKNEHEEDFEENDENEENKASDDKASASTLGENILEKNRDIEIEEIELLSAFAKIAEAEQSLSTNEDFKQLLQENEEIIPGFQDSEDRAGKRRNSETSNIYEETSSSRKTNIESEDVFNLEEDGFSSDSSESSKSSKSSSSETYQDHDHTNFSTLREVVKTFNQVAESVSQQNREKSKLIKELIANPLTKTFSAQTSEQINHQVEALKQEQRDRLSQLVDCVYAQKDKYDDTLEVVNGRLMVVKRSTGALEELPPPPTSRPSGSTKYISCGVSATQTSSNYDDNDFDDYGTVLSEDNEDDGDEDDIEQHASDTKIKRILYSSPLSDANCAKDSVSLSSSGSSTEIEREEGKNYHHLDFGSQQEAARRLYNEIDTDAAAEVLPEFSKGLEKEAGETAADYMLTLEKKKGKEEMMLMQKFSEVAGDGQQINELQVELDDSTQSFMDFGDAAAVLEDIALIFENPEGVE